MADGDKDPRPPTPLYVVIPPSALFAAHWSFFIPELLPFDPITKRHEEAKLGRRIHATGDRLNGFKLEIIRNYDISKHRSVGTRRFAIGLLPSKYLQSVRIPASEGLRKDDDEGGGYVDNEPTDDFEKLCVEVETPGPSLNSAQSNGRRVKSEVKDCQWWVRKVVEALEERGMVEPLPGRDGDIKSAKDKVLALPMH